MAVRRRPLTVVAPARLVEFDPQDWPGGWWDAFDAWKQARRGYETRFPGSLGNTLQLMRVERAVWEQRPTLEAS
jgi:hypothetical protein